MNKKHSQGQVGLLLLVIMGVVIALVMSVASRSLSDTVLSRQERESSAVFTIAETGVEKALNSLSQGVVPSGTPALTDSTGLVTGQYGVTTSSSYALYVPEQEVAQLNLSPFVTPIAIRWTKVGDLTENVATCAGGSGKAPAAVEITSISATFEKRSYFNPSSCVPEGTSGFSNLAVNTNPTYRSSISYTVPAGTTIVRIRPIYSGATISVTGVGLATQLYVIHSSASGGDAQKDIQVARGLAAPSSVFILPFFPVTR